MASKIKAIGVITNLHSGHTWATSFSWELTLYMSEQLFDHYMVAYIAEEV
jgi:hypothetical protein